MVLFLCLPVTGYLVLLLLFVVDCTIPATTESERVAKMSLVISTAASLTITTTRLRRRGFLRTNVNFNSSHPLFLIPRRGNLQSLPLSLRTHSRQSSFRSISAVGIGGAVLQDAGATTLVLAGAYALVSTFDNLTKHNVIQQSLSRKLVHILSGLLFMVSWPIFSTSTGARYFASLVPLVNCFRLVVHGLSLATDEGLVKSVTREGKPEELLRGPFYYVLVLIVCALIFWRESPVAIISLSMMCGGDGVADIIGRRFGSEKLPYNQQKSWAGSISMFTCGSLISIGMLYYFSVLGYFQLDWGTTVGRVALVSLLATVVESLPTTDVVDDNISVPLATMAAAFLCFCHYY